MRQAPTTPLSLRIVALGVVLAVVAACAGQGSEPPTVVPKVATPTSGPTPSAGSPPLSPVLINSVFVPGRNRFVIVLLDQNQQPVSDAVVNATFELPATGVQLGQSFTARHIAGDAQEADTARVEAGLTFFTAEPDFPTPGRWRVVLGIAYKGEPFQVAATFDVAPSSPQPAIGADVPRTEQAVLGGGIPVDQIHSGLDADPALHSVTIRDAVTRGTPAIIGFATPGFCQTRICGPLVEEVLQPLEERYSGRVSVLHVEPIDVPLARLGQLVKSPAMGEWGLETEPWVFIVDSEGKLSAKFEGPVSLSEVEAALLTVISGRAR